MDDIKELKRVTALEMQGSLDSDGLKAFVEVPRQYISIECKHTSFNHLMKIHPYRQYISLECKHTNFNHLMKIHPRYNTLQLFPHPNYIHLPFSF